MIPRYARKEAAEIWSPRTRFKIMFEIEAHAADAMADLGVIPKEAAAVMLFFVNLIALGGGPPFTGWVIDHYAAFHFAHPDQAGVWAAVSNFWNASPKAFQAACPGGMAPAGSGAALAASCHGALVLGTRHGILVTYAFALLAAFHYLLASFGLGKAMAKARADRGEI